MRNMAVLHSPAFSYPLPVLVRVLFNLLIFKGKILYYNKYNKRVSYRNEKKEAFIPILKINILTKMVLITVSVYMAKIEFFSFILKNLRTFVPTF